jgi:hypothetical protein
MLIDIYRDALERRHGSAVRVPAGQATIPVAAPKVA